MVLCGAAEASSKQLREGGNETSLLTASAAQRCPSVATSYTIQQEELFGLRLQTSVLHSSSLPWQSQQNGGGCKEWRKARVD